MYDFHIIFLTVGLNWYTFCCYNAIPEAENCLNKRVLFNSQFIGLKA